MSKKYFDAPHYSYENHKAFRIGHFKRDKKMFIEQRKSDGNQTSEEDLKALEIRFMGNEIKDVDNILSGKLSISERLLRSRGRCYAEDLTGEITTVYIPSGALISERKIAPTRSYKEPLALSESDRIELNKWKSFVSARIEQLTTGTLSVSPFEGKGYPEAINIGRDIFDQIELWLVDSKYLDVDGKWIGGKNELAIFLQFLINKDVVRIADHQKPKRTRFRKFMEIRYSEDVADQFRPSKIDKKNGIYELFETGLLTIINPASR